MVTKMIQAQFRESQSKEFSVAIKDALYYSPRTKVVVLPDSKAYLVPKDVLRLEQDKSSSVSASFSILDKSIKIDFCNDASMLAFLGCFSKWKPNLPMSSMREACFCVLNGLATIPEDKMLDENATIGDLVCSKMRAKVGAKQKKLADFSDIKLSGLFDETNVTKDPTPCSEIAKAEVKLSAKSKDAHGRSFIELVVEGDFGDGQEEVSNRFYNASNANLNDVAGMSKIAAMKTKTGFMVMPMESVGMSASVLSYKVSPTKEAKQIVKGLPIALYRAAYYEYLMRQGVTSDI